MSSVEPTVPATAPGAAPTSSSTKRSFGPAWRKDGGSFGKPPLVAVAQPGDNGNNVIGNRLPFGAPLPQQQQQQRGQQQQHHHQQQQQQQPPLGMLRGARSDGGGVVWPPQQHHHQQQQQQHHQQMMPQTARGASNGAPVLSSQVRNKRKQKLSREQLLAIRKPTTVLESMRAALPAEIVAVEPLMPMLLSKRLSPPEIAAAWEAAISVSSKKPGSTETSPSIRPTPHNKSPIPAPTIARGSSLEKQQGPWERGMSVPVASATEKLWDEPDDSETFGDSDTATALSSWSEAASRFEKERREMRNNPEAMQMMQEMIGNSGNDMFGAAFSGSGGIEDDNYEKKPDVESANAAARAAEALDVLEAAAAASAVARKTESADWMVLPWYYRDPQGDHQGPFLADQMKQWFDAGYFNDDLPLRLGDHASSPFVPLGELFPIAEEAFVSPPRFPPVAPPASSNSRVSSSSSQQQPQQPDIDTQASWNSLLGQPTEETASTKKGKDAFGWTWGGAGGAPAAAAAAAAAMEAEDDATSDSVLGGGAFGGSGGRWPVGQNSGAVAQLGGSLFAPPAPVVTTAAPEKKQAAPSPKKKKPPQETKRAPAADVDSTLALKMMLGMGGVSAEDHNPHQQAQQQQQQQQQQAQQQQAQQLQQQQQQQQQAQAQQQARQQQAQQQQQQQQHAQQQAQQQRQQQQQQAQQQQQQQQQAQQQQRKPQPPAPPPAPSPPQPQWQAAPVKRLSMYEIQQQEETEARERARMMRAQQAAAAQTGSMVPNPVHSSMAARLAAQQKQQQTPQQQRALAAAQQQQQMLIQQQQRQIQLQQQQQQQQQNALFAEEQQRALRTQQQQNAASAQVNSQRRRAAPAPAPAATKTTTEFGTANATPEALIEWCKSQLKKIGHSDEHITLIEFCMSLEDTSEIRQYLSMYLGSTPQVAAFASEFIKRKQGKAGGFGASGSVASSQPAATQEMEVVVKRRRPKKNAPPK